MSTSPRRWRRGCRSSSSARSPWSCSTPSTPDGRFGLILSATAAIPSAHQNSEGGTPMADSDWRKYKRLRGGDLPADLAFGGAAYRLGKLLKRDFYAAVGIYDRVAGTAAVPEQVLLKIYHTDPFWGIPLGWLGRWLARREIAAYRV